ncbi:Alpha/Beta hydrolase protein [Dissophora ornata]|nr:Alpha/Beta hydrolase protein [Dissophora ornata]
MIANLLATALVLCILGVLFLLIAYLTSLAILLFVPWTQAYLVFAHWLRLQNPARLLTPEAYTLRPFSTRNIRISTSDGLHLGAWHILPTSTPKATLKKIHANEPLAPRPRRNSGSNGGEERVVNERTEAIFEEALKAAERVVLYFHGQVGDRGKSNRIGTYKGIQEAMPSAHIITIDCRGYGDSEGFPSEIGFKTDSFAAWQWVTERVASEKVIIYGHSLGSGIATNLCLQLEEQHITPMAMVLDAAFTSMPDMMTAYRKIPIVRPFARFPFLLNHFKMRLMDRFETVRAVETIKSPLLLIHGQEDADVLISNSHTLFHTALTARRLQSCTKELAVTEAGEAASAEDELARAGMDVPFQTSYSTSRDVGSKDSQVLQRTVKGAESMLAKDSQLSPVSSDSGIESEAASGRSSAFATTPQQSSSGSGGSAHYQLHHEHEQEHGHGRGQNGQGNGQCHTVQLDFPREGSLEYNQEYQIGFLTVEYAVHNTCMDFAISKEVMGSFLRTVENSRRVQAWGDIPETAESKRAQEIDLAKVLCNDKLGYVDQSEVPEVVE